MFKSLSKYDIIAVCTFALIMVLWMAGLTTVVARNQQTSADNAVVVTTNESVPDEVPKGPETVDPTECTTGSASTLVPVKPLIENTKPTEPTEPEVTEPTKKPVNDKDLSGSDNKDEPAKKPSDSSPTIEDKPDEGKMSETEMLACVIYQEVGGNMHCDECRRRVADVVLNRVADSRFPDSIEEVLTAKNQYGRFYYTGIKWADRHTRPGEKEAVERAWRIAEEVMAGNHSDLYGNGYVWQAGFKQGTSGFWCCGHYFAKGKA